MGLLKLGSVLHQMAGKQGDYCFHRAKGLCDLFRVKLLLLPGPEKYRGGPCMFLVRISLICNQHQSTRAGVLTWHLQQANHRCWADFFIDVVLSEGNAQMLSRWVAQQVEGKFCVFRQLHVDRLDAALKGQWLAGWLSTMCSPCS